MNNTKMKLRNNSIYTASKLGINLTKVVQDVCTEKYITLLR